MIVSRPHPPPTALAKAETFAEFFSGMGRSPLGAGPLVQGLRTCSQRRSFSSLSAARELPDLCVKRQVRAMRERVTADPRATNAPPAARGPSPRSSARGFLLPCPFMAKSPRFAQRPSQQKS
jgi:hypothetical protein